MLRGDTVVHWFALAPHTKKGAGAISGSVLFVGSLRGKFGTTSQVEGLFCLPMWFVFPQPKAAGISTPLEVKIDGGKDWDQS